MAVDADLQIDGIKGESMDQHHKIGSKSPTLAGRVPQPRSSTSSTADGFSMCDHRQVQHPVQSGRRIPCGGCPMRLALLACLILASAAQAQVVECPAFYPSLDTVLSEVPHQHKGKGLVRKGRLSGAAMSEGKFNGDAMSMVHGLRTETKDSWEEEFPIFRGPKWLICFYAPGNISWWEQLEDRPAACRLNVAKKNAEGVMKATLTCK